MENEEFERWLELMRARARNLNRQSPIYDLFAGRKVWFWRNGEYKIFNTNYDGTIA